MDMYQHITLRSTVHIVTTEHLADDTTLGVCCYTFVQVYLHIASSRSCLTDRNLFCCWRGRRISDIIIATLTATKHTTIVVSTTTRTYLGAHLTTRDVH